MQDLQNKTRKIYGRRCIMVPTKKFASREEVVDFAKNVLKLDDYEITKTGPTTWRLYKPLEAKGKTAKSTQGAKASKPKRPSKKQPAQTTITEQVAKPATKPAAKSSKKQPAQQPVQQPAAKPSAKRGSQSSKKKSAQPPAVEPAVEPVEQPVEQPVVQPATILPTEKKIVTEQPAISRELVDEIRAMRSGFEAQMFALQAEISKLTGLLVLISKTPIEQPPSVTEAIFAPVPEPEAAIELEPNVEATAMPEAGEEATLEVCEEPEVPAEPAEEPEVPTEEKAAEEKITLPRLEKKIMQKLKKMLDRKSPETSTTTIANIALAVSRRPGVVEESVKKLDERGYAKLEGTGNDAIVRLAENGWNVKIA